ncbi:MAG TPA: hypothetical protein VHL58_02410 [Thermoanaerobaculia bacterium]|nr:hypothetical protein [Thermoanaerobaculia bacterium]
MTSVFATNGQAPTNDHHDQAWKDSAAFCLMRGRFATTQWSLVLAAGRRKIK